MTQNTINDVEEPEVLEGNGDASRWTRAGHDRVYVNNGDFKDKAYIDLQEGEFVAEYRYAPDYEMEIDGGVATITEDGEVVVRVRLWETEDDEEAETDDIDATDDVDETESDERTQTEIGDIRESREAREKKALKMGSQAEGAEAGTFVCPVCGEHEPDETVGAFGIGDYHVKHLSEEEEEYARERQKSDESELDRMEFEEVAAKHKF